LWRSDPCLPCAVALAVLRAFVLLALFCSVQHFFPYRHSQAGLDEAGSRLNRDRSNRSGFGKGCDWHCVECCWHRRPFAHWIGLSRIVISTQQYSTHLRFHSYLLLNLGLRVDLTRVDCLVKVRIFRLPNIPLYCHPDLDGSRAVLYYVKQNNSILGIT
jgi:hypothetical protein